MTINTINYFSSEQKTKITKYEQRKTHNVEREQNTRLYRISSRHESANLAKVSYVVNCNRIDFELSVCSIVWRYVQQQTMFVY